MEADKTFKTLVEMNVNDYTEKKNGLTYLSWAFAWQKFKETCPDAAYEIKKNADGTPIFGSAKLGYMVYTNVTAAGQTYEMWLPVMDNNNNPMLDEPYTYKVKKYEWNERSRKKEWNGEYEDKEVAAITMFDVNKAVMRCLVKNIAMFGLGLYIYAGDDLPSEVFEPITDEQKAQFAKLNVNVPNTLKYYKVERIEQLSRSQADYVIEAKRKAVERDEQNV